MAVIEVDISYLGCSTPRHHMMGEALLGEYGPTLLTGFKIGISA